MICELLIKLDHSISLGITCDHVNDNNSSAKCPLSLSLNIEKLVFLFIVSRRTDFVLFIFYTKCIRSTKKINKEYNFVIGGKKNIYLRCDSLFHLTHKMKLICNSVKYDF